MTIKVFTVLFMLAAVGCGGSRHGADGSGDATDSAEDALSNEIADHVSDDVAQEASTDATTDAASDAAADTAMSEASADAMPDADDASDDTSDDASDAVSADASDAPDASHPSVAPGDLVTMECYIDPIWGYVCSPAVYYIGTDLRRYVFPNERTYFSWYTDFSGVRQIPRDELTAILIGGNVTIRPGTWLVKITTDPRTYAVTRCGTLHWVQSETLAVQLYGPDWRLHIADVPDAFIVNYTYVMGTDISTPIHPDGTLIRYAGSPDVYVMDMGSRRRLAPGAFEANRFQSVSSSLLGTLPPISYIVDTDIAYPDGSPVLGREPQLEETVCVGVR